MSAELDLLAAGGGASAVTALVAWAVRRFAERADTAEDDARHEAAVKLDQVVTAMNDMRSDVRVLVSELGTHRGVVAKVEQRIDGISSNHGQRLGELERRVTILESTPPKVRR